eukprot:XP_001700650.1 predicted protein [Chlamydomonas reinhardtii]
MAAYRYDLGRFGNSVALWLGGIHPGEVTSVLRAGGAPELLGALLEGESLFNDASGIVLFDIFLRKVLQARRAGAFDRFWDVLSFCVNGLIFFLLGASSVNYLIR